MSNYTPGPWEWDGDDNNLVIRPRRITEDNEVSVIAVLPLESYEYLEDWSECSWSAEGEANARLIAAAPEMKDLLKAAAPYASIMDDDFEGADGGRAGALFDAIIALLRRIDGEEEPE